VNTDHVHLEATLHSAEREAHATHDLEVLDSEVELQ
jgi:hypothetical protein